MDMDLAAAEIFQCIESEPFPDYYHRLIRYVEHVAGKPIVVKFLDYAKIATKIGPEYVEAVRKRCPDMTPEEADYIMQDLSRPPWGAVLCEKENRIVIVLPSFDTPSVDPAYDRFYRDRSSRTLLYCLYLGAELFGRLQPLEGPRGIQGGDSEALNIRLTVEAATRAGLVVFDSEALRRILESWPDPWAKQAERLFSEYRQQAMNKPQLVFTLPMNSISSRDLSMSLSHASRLSGILALLYAENTSPNILAEIAMSPSSTVFDLQQVRVSSPGHFVLALTQTYHYLCGVLARVRTSLKQIPFIDLHVERREAELRADIEVHRERESRARLVRKANEYMEASLGKDRHDLLLAVEEAYHVHDRLKQLGLSGGDVAKKLLESSQILQEKNMTVSD